MIEMVTVIKTIWSRQMGKRRRNRTKETIVNWVYRLTTLRVCSRFRTASDEAELVVAHIQNRTQECGKISLT